jgi:hypothetical protein
MVSEEISTIKMKLNTLHWDNRKTSWRLARLHPMQAQGYERINSVERICCKSTLGHFAYTGMPSQLFPQGSFHYSWPSRHSATMA